MLTLDGYRTSAVGHGSLSDGSTLDHSGVVDEGHCTAGQAEGCAAVEAHSIIANNHTPTAAIAY